MSINLRGACALTLVVTLIGSAAAQSSEALTSPAAEPLGSAFNLEEIGKVQLASCECGEYGSEYGSCDACDLGGCCGPVCPRPRIFVGAEYLSVRAEFSEATAYREFNLVNQTETFQQFDMEYGDSYRIFGGLRLDDCGGELRFTYTNFDSSGSFNTGPLADATTSGVSFTSPFEIVPAGAGDSLSGEADVSIDNYDIGFSRTIPLGSPLACNTCCDPCGECCPCPAWDIQWSGGIRVANVDSRLSYASTIVSTTAVPARTAESLVSFDGVGLRTGLLGRRYIGRTGYASFFVRGDISLLLGDVDYSVAAPPTAGSAFLPVQMTSTQVIPVTEIEAGGTVYLTSRLSVTGGYLLSAWHDLGHRAEYDYSANGTQLQLMDDANMMTLDGFFIRAEATF